MATWSSEGSRWRISLGESSQADEWGEEIESLQRFLMISWYGTNPASDKIEEIVVRWGNGKIKFCTWLYLSCALYNNIVSHGAQDWDIRRYLVVQLQRGVEVDRKRYKHDKQDPLGIYERDWFPSTYYFCDYNKYTNETNKYEGPKQFN